MINPRHRPILYAAIAVIAVWLIAWAGYIYAHNSKITPEKVLAALHSLNLSKLSGDARAKALHSLAEMLNALSGDDRRRARMDKEWALLFQQMTDQEKADFLETTLPTGFKQMLASFEQLPEDKRKRAVNDAVKKLREARENPPPAPDADPSQPTRKQTNNAPELSPQMQEKVIKMGLNAFYTQSSAQTKAELGPFMEELQRSLENGRFFMGR